MVEREALDDRVSSRGLTLTAERLETKYLVPAVSARVLARELAARLPLDRFRASAELAPGADDYVTTIYFDTKERDLYQRALHSGVHHKIRAREYYSVNRPSHRPGSDAPELVRSTATLWLEVKRRDGRRTRKRRLGIPKRDLGRLFETRALNLATLERLGAEYGSGAASLLEEVAGICRRYPSPLLPACVVNYRRLAFQDERGKLRVTLDRKIAFFAPASDLFTRESELVRETLGKPAAQLPTAVMEIKTRARAPLWLANLLREHELTPQRFSKFVAASQPVYG